MEFRFESATCRLREHGDGTADVTHVYAENRGLGHATGLLKAVIEYAESRDLQLYLLARGYGGPIQTMLNPEQLQAFYEKFGFERMGDGLPGVRMTRPRRKNTPYDEREN